MTYRRGLQCNNDCLPIEPISYPFMRLDISASLQYTPEFQRGRLQ